MDAVLLRYEKESADWLILFLVDYYVKLSNLLDAIRALNQIEHEIHDGYCTDTVQLQKSNSEGIPNPTTAQ